MSQEELKIWPIVVKTDDHTIDVQWVDQHGLQVVAVIRDDFGNKFALAWDENRQRFSTHRQYSGHEGYPHPYLEHGRYMRTDVGYPEAVASLLKRADRPCDPYIVQEWISMLKGVQ
jgi:hypothetical protein